MPKRGVSLPRTGRPSWATATAGISRTENNSARSAVPWVRDILLGVRVRVPGAGKLLAGWRRSLAREHDDRGGAGWISAAMLDVGRQPRPPCEPRQHLRGGWILIPLRPIGLRSRLRAPFRGPLDTGANPPHLPPPHPP